MKIASTVRLLAVGDVEVYAHVAFLGLNAFLFEELAQNTSRMMTIIKLLAAPLVLVTLLITPLLGEESPFFGGDDKDTKEEDAAFGGFDDSKEEGETPKPEQPQQAQDNKPQVTHNTGFMNLIKDYAQTKNVPTKTYGNGAFRIMVVGRGASFDFDAMLKAGEVALQGLDLWTGKSDILPVTRSKDHLCSYAVVMASDKTFDDFLSYTRKKHEGYRHNGQGDDLTAKLRSFNHPRVAVTSASKIRPQTQLHFAVYHAANKAIDTFFHEHSKNRKVPWLREGLNAELQRIVPKSIDSSSAAMVFYRTIAYENSSGDPVTEWNAALKKAIKSGDRGLYTATDVLRAELISLPTLNYIQLWSLTKYLIAQGRNQKGEKNKIRLMLLELAEGRSSDVVVPEVFKSNDPALTRSWFRWASSQR